MGSRLTVSSSYKKISLLFSLGIVEPARGFEKENQSLDGIKKKNSSLSHFYLETIQMAFF